MKRPRLAALLGLALGSALACAAAAPPSAPAQAPWGEAAPPATFTGEALYDHIDGGAEPFLELGFETCRVRRLARPGAEVTVEDYRMADAAAALGIYLMQCGREAPDPTLPERHTVGKTQLLLLKGRHLLRLTGRPDACPSRADLVALAAAEAAPLPAEPPPEVLKLLPAEEMRPGSLRIARGPVTLQALAPPFEGDALLLDRRVTAVAADYDDLPYGSHSLLVAPYPDEPAALKALANLRAHMEPGTRVDSKGDREFLFQQDPASILGRAWVEGKTLTLTWGMIVKAPPQAP